MYKKKGRTFLTLLRHAEIRGTYIHTYYTFLAVRDGRLSKRDLFYVGTQ